VPGRLLVDEDGWAETPDGKMLMRRPKLSFGPDFSLTAEMLTYERSSQSLVATGSVRVQRGTDSFLADRYVLPDDIRDEFACSYGRSLITNEEFLFDILWTPRR
jgi:hypothetical protein